MTIDERLEAFTQTVELMAATQSEDHDRWEEHAARHNRQMADIDRRLSRAIRNGIEEARRERQRRRETTSELDTKITQLAAAQLVTEERLASLGGKIDKLVDAMLRTRGNGKPEGQR